MKKLDICTGILMRINQILAIMVLMAVFVLPFIFIWQEDGALVALLLYFIPFIGIIAMFFSSRIILVILWNLGLYCVFTWIFPKDLGITIKSIFGKIISKIYTIMNLVLLGGIQLCWLLNINSFSFDGLEHTFDVFPIDKVFSVLKIDSIICVLIIVVLGIEHIVLEIIDKE